MSERRRPNRQIQRAARERAKAQSISYQAALQQEQANAAPAAQSLALLGVQSCGCITLVDCSDEPGRETQKAISEIIARGGTAERVPLDEARQRPNFFPSECPHDPKGWEPRAEPDPNQVTFRFKRGYKRNVSIVYAKNRYYSGGIRAGEVMDRGGEFWATEDWFREDGTAGAGEKDGSHVQTGFPTKKAAGQWLADRFNERTVAKAKQRWLEREANPPARSGEIPTHTKSGEPVPNFAVGEIWTHMSAEYEILDLPEIDKDYGSVIVRARPIGDSDHRDPEDWLMPTWTLVSESCFPYMKRKQPANI